MLLQVDRQVSEQVGSNAICESFLRQEEIPIYRFPFGFQQTQAFTETCLEFFDTPYLPDDDPRKNLAYAYMQLNRDPQLRFHWENATIAYYLSDKPSYRRRGSRALLEPNVRQMARAIHNVAADQDLQTQFEASSELFQDLAVKGLEITFAHTDNISVTNLRGIGRRSRELGIQACPEAIYQLRLFAHGKYVARVGFNIHKEDEKTVVSIVNMQGAEGIDFNAFKYAHGEKPVNILLERLLAFSQVDKERPLLFRGITNHPKGNPLLYYSAFSRFFRRKLIEPMEYVPKPRYPNDLPES